MSGTDARRQDPAGRYGKTYISLKVSAKTHDTALSVTVCATGNEKEI